VTGWSLPSPNRSRKNGPNSAPRSERLAVSDVVVAFGGPESLRAIRAQTPPDGRFVPFGHRTSAGYIARESLVDTERARACALGAIRDALLYDGEGCLSLHVLFVERDGDVSIDRFVALAREALEATALEFPAGSDELSPPTSIARNAARFRASQRGGAVIAGAAQGLLLIDPPQEELPPLVPRALALYPVGGADEALGFLRRHALPLVGFATNDAGRADILGLAVASGASQIARLGTLQAPSLAGEHGGVGRILPFVRAITKTG